MALTRHSIRYPSRPVLASILAVAGLAGGCQRSLFDADPGTAGPGNSNGGPDAAGMDPDAADAGQGNVDCPSPCVGNAARDFSMSQPSGSWRYADLLPNVSYGTRYTEMVPGDWNGMQGWISTQIEPPYDPAIVGCVVNASNPQCRGLEQSLLLAVPERTGAVLYPTLRWTAPRTGAYRVRGRWRSADTVSETVAGLLLLSRNSQYDSLASEDFSTIPTPIERDHEIDAVAGDAIALTAMHDDAPSAAALGVELFITDLQSPGSCLMAARFEGASFPNHCGDSMFEDDAQTGAQCNGAACMPTQDADPPPGIPGRARRFVEGSSMQYQGPPIDYSGDWTLQLWVNLELGESGEKQWLLSDLDCEQQGGVGISFDNESLYFELFQEESVPVGCTVGAPDSLAVPFAADRDWHFVRMVRRKDQGMVSVCVDGLTRSDIQVPPTAAMPTSLPLVLGRRDGDAHFDGQLADLRVLARALPCGSSP